MKLLKLLFAIFSAYPTLAVADVCNEGRFEITTGGRLQNFTGEIRYSSHRGRLNGYIAFDVYNRHPEALSDFRCYNEGRNSGVLTFTRSWSTGSQTYMLSIDGNHLTGYYDYYGDNSYMATRHQVSGRGWAR